MKCPNCGNEFEGNFCSNCGFSPNSVQNQQINPMPQKKKHTGGKVIGVIAIAFVAIMIILAATGALESSPKKETTSTSGTTSSIVTTEAKEDVFGQNETAVFDSLKITATEIKQTEGTEFFKPENGNKFVGVKFSIENITDKDQYISSLLLFDAYVDGIKCDYSISANCAFDSGKLDGNIAPGKKMVGYYAVEVPKDWKELELQVKSEWLSNSKAKFLFKK